MQLSSISLALTRAGMLSAFDPLSLFTAGEQGVWYDPSDFNNYMDPLGSELVTNGDFSGGATGWTPNAAVTQSVSSGQLQLLASTGTSNFYTSQSISVSAGKWYKITGTVTSAVGNSAVRARLRIANSGVNTDIQAQVAGVPVTQTLYVLATGSTISLEPGVASTAAWGAVGDIAYFDNISVKELTGLSAATLFQDSAGTLPVTAVEQPVGLMLDKSKGLVLGSELVTNGTFDSGITGWTNSADGTQSWNAGVLQYTRGAATGRSTQSYSLTAGGGKWYEVTGRCRLVSGSGSASLALVTQGGTTFAASVSVGVSTFTDVVAYGYAPAGSGSYIVQLVTGGSSGAVTEFDNISVKELPGNHAYQSTSAARPVLSARVNLLTKTQDFSDAVWTALNGASKTSASSFTMTATNSRIYQSVTLAAGVAFKLSVTFSAADVGKSIRLAYFDSVNGWELGSDIVIPSDGVVSRAFTPSNAGTLAGFQAASTLASSTTFTLLSGFGADLRVSNDGVGIPAYQRVNTSTDYDTVGFPLYIKPNGSSQFMVTNSINFSATDKMTVWAGVRKFSSSTFQIITELGTDSYSVAGTFGIFPTGPVSRTESYSTFLRGSTIGYAGFGPCASPITNVLALSYDIGEVSITGEIAASINGVAVPYETTGLSAGTGNYGNYPLYLFARGGSSLWFGGRMYSMIIRGAASTAGQISQTETYVNSKTKAY